MLTKFSLSGLIRIMLASVFILAGIAKLRDSTQTTSSFESTGVPAPFSKSLARFMPSLELAVAAGLLWNRTVQWAAGIASGMLIAFTVFIWRNIATGRDTRCACFGQHFDSISGWRAIARNASLMVMTSMIAAPNILGSARRTAAKLSSAELASLFLMTILPSLVAVEGWRRHSQVRTTPLHHDHAGPNIGEPIPDVMLRRPGAEPVSVAELLEASWSNEVVFMFISFNCAPCRSLIDALDRESQDSLKYAIHLVVQEFGSYGDVQEVQIANLSPWLKHSLIIDGSARSSVPLIATLGVAGLPCALLVSSSDRTVQAAVTGKEEIAKLLDL